MSWRHWATAAGLGLGFGAGHATGFILVVFQNAPSSARLGIAVVVLTRWTFLMLVVALFVAFGCALLHQLQRRSQARPRHVVLMVCGVTVLGIALDPLAVGLCSRVHSALAVPTVPFWAGVNRLTLLGRMWTQSVPELLAGSLMSALTVIYVQRSRTTATALADAQVRLADVQRRALAEQLQTAQATVEPAFLFATLNHVQRCFQRRAASGQRLLHALIGYLRAALPSGDEAIGTLAQQAELVRSYLEIAAIASGGRLRAEVDVPATLAHRPFAPSLILPLVSLARGDGDTVSWASEIAVRVSLADGRLTVTVHDDRVRGDGDAGTAIHAAVRQRIATLYGPRARLSVAARLPRGATATIEIDDRQTP
jgi:Histidine kinase